MKAMGYIRVSTTEQAAEGISLAAQSEKIRQYCQLKDFDLVEIIEDAGLSGKNCNRPGIQQLIALVKSRKVDAVVVYKLDRLSRSTVDCLNLVDQMDKAGIAFHSITETVDTRGAMGRFFFTILAAAAQMERDKISERTSDALQSKIRRGERAGTIPYGYELDKDGMSLIENPKEQEVLFDIHRLREKGYTLRHIADELNESGFTTRRGGAWKKQYIGNFLKKAA
ncbi:MAG TPA: recombinase family protein [archaeon]|nr:recombinase family protein [archaeon]